MATQREDVEAYLESVGFRTPIIDDFSSLTFICTDSPRLYITIRYIPSSIPFGTTIHPTNISLTRREFCSKEGLPYERVLTLRSNVTTWDQVLAYVKEFTNAPNS